MPAPLSIFNQPNQPKLFSSWPGGVGAPDVPIPLAGGRRRRTHHKRKSHRRNRTMHRRRR